MPTVIPALDRALPLTRLRVRSTTGNACDFYFARVELLDINNKATDMTKPDGQVFEKGFSVCQ